MEHRDIIKPLQIGNVTMENNLILAPMAGVSDLPFRLLCREQGAGLVCMEMVSAKAILYKNRNTEELLMIDTEEHPVSLQLFGSDPDIMGEIAKQIEERPFDILDINMGCPVPKVVNNGDGSALMKNPVLAGKIIEKTAQAIKKPVTVKIRKGFDDAHINAVELAHIAQESGAAAVAVHGRTREQFYAGKADWDIIQTGEGGGLDPCDRKRGYPDCGRRCRDGGTDGMRWIYDRTRRGGESVDLPTDPPLFSDGGDTREAVLCRGDGNAAAPCGDADCLQRGVSQMPRNPQTRGMVHSGLPQFLKAAWKDQ